MRLARRVSVLVIASLVGFAACGGDDDKGAAASSTTTAADRTTTTAAAPSAEAAALEALLITEVPAGFERQADDVGDTGPSDLAKAVRDDGSDDAREVLTKAGFVAGYQRLWMNDADDELIVFLYQFEDGAGATTYGTRTIADSEGATPFAVSGIPGAKGFQLTDEEGSSAVILFIKGPYLVQVVHGASAAAGQTDLLTGLATAQFQRLPGAVA